MKIKDITELFERDFPASLACEWDNSGFLAGDANRDVNKILFTCDVDMGVVKEALHLNAQLIVSHHPLMFHKISRLTEDDPEQSVLRFMIKNDIALYSAHTNLDAARGGLNDYMAELLGMKNTSVIDVSATCGGCEHGFGRAAILDEPITLKNLMNKVIKIFGADGVRYAGDENAAIKKLAVNCGGGADIIYRAVEIGCDALITGDIKYNGYLDALSRGMCVIDLMHYDSEHIVMDFFEKYFSKKLCGVETVKSSANKNAVKTYTL